MKTTEAKSTETKSPKAPKSDKPVKVVPSVLGVNVDLINKSIGDVKSLAGRVKSKAREAGIVASITELDLNANEVVTDKQLTKLVKDKVCTKEQAAKIRAMHALNKAIQALIK